MSAVISAPAMRRVLSLPKKAPSEAPAPGKWRPSGKNPETLEAIAWLGTLPCCQMIRPLRIGIRDDLYAILPPNIKSKSLCRAMFWWVTQREYLAAASQPGAQRVGVHGEPAGAVSEREAAYSATLLQRWMS